MFTARAARRGFTLIEVAVVLVSIALLAAIAIPSYSTFMDETDVRAARAEAELLVKNAAGVSSQDGYIYDCSPGAEADTVSFESALEQVDAEQGQSPYEAPDDQWVDFLGVETPASGVGTIQVIGERWTHYFLVDLCTGELTDTYADPGDGEPAVQLAIDYPDESFNPLVPSDALAPQILGGDGGPITFSVAGDLPPGVTFDPDTGTFTGASEWNFKATQLSGKSEYGCAVTLQTTVVCWGSNNSGALGRGTVAGVDGAALSMGPGQVLAPGESAGGQPLTGVREVAVGTNFACSLLLDGRVLCWGDNDEGQLGIGVTSSAVSVPNYVVGVGESTGGSHLASVSDIDAGTSHACAVRSSGHAVCWGGGAYGILGDAVVHESGSPAPQEVLAPGEVAGGALLSGVSQVQAGHMHSCAVLASSEAVCWGYNPQGELGTGFAGSGLYGVDARAPMYVIGVGEAQGGAHLTGVASIDAGTEMSCATLSGGQVACWGRNALGSPRGLLGTGSTDARVLAPELVLNDAGYLGNADSVSLSNYHYRACAVITDGSVQCWGMLATLSQSALAQFGRGTLITLDSSAYAVMYDPAPVAVATESLTSPDSVGGALTGVEQVGHAACGLTTSQAIYCWGTMNALLNNVGLEDQAADYAYSSHYPLRVTKSGPMPGFPATVTVTATDSSGDSASTNLSLSVS